MKLSVLVAVLLLILCNLASAQIHVERAAAGLDGYVRGEKWVPVIFDLANFGEDFEGTIQVMKGETVFKKSLHLGSAAKKRIEIIYYHSTYYEELKYQILDAKGRVVNKGPLTVRPLNYQDNFVLVISDTEYNHQFLNGVPNPWGGKTFVGYVKGVDMYPEWLAYGTADVIAIGNISPAQLSQSQWNSLVLWNSSGGILVASPGTNVAALQNPLIRDNLPVFSVDNNRTSAGEFLLSKWATRSANPFPQMIIPAESITTRPCDRQLTVLPDGSPLVTSSPFYKGNVIYFAFDYTRLPEEVTGPLSAYWNDVIFQTTGAPPQFSLPFRKRLEENPRIQKFLYDVPGLKLPDVKWFALFFFIYLFAVGPLQYFLLQILKKRSFLWLTFPLIILIFSVSAFGYSRMRHSTQKRITQVRVTELFPALSRQVVYQVFGLATNESGTFQFGAPQENSYLRKFMMQSFNYVPEPYALSEDLPHQILGEKLKDWTFRTFDAVTAEPMSSAQLELSISVRGASLTGKITNRSPNTISESFFYYDARNAATLGIIEPGQSKDFSLILDNSAPVPFSMPQLNDLLNLYNLSYADPHFFFGQLQNQAGALIVNGESRQTTLTQYIAYFIETKEAAPVSSSVRP